MGVAPSQRSAVPAPVGRELLWLIALVIGMDGLFILIYFLAHISTGSDRAKLIFTAVWTLTVLLVVVRGLSRIRRTRLKSAAKGPSS